MSAACCSSVLLTEVGWGQCSPGQVGRRALLIPLPFLFQRARQMDEELSRRGSPIPKKVGWFSPQEILCFGKVGPHSWPFPQYECMEVHRQLLRGIGGAHSGARQCFCL